NASRLAAKMSTEGNEANEEGSEQGDGRPAFARILPSFPSLQKNVGLVLRGANSVTYSVAQVSKPAVSRISKSASARTKDGLPTGSRRYSRFGNLRYVIVFAPACTKVRGLPLVLVLVLVLVLEPQAVQFEDEDEGRARGRGWLIPP